MWQRVKRVVAKVTGLDRVIRQVHDRLDRIERRSRENDAVTLVLPATMLMEHALVDSELTVTIVMATRDRRAMLERAVRSVVAQQYPGWQLVIVDDGSSDGSAEYLDSLTDERIEVVHVDHAGAAAARNIGIDRARGEWVTFLDDDNVMTSVWTKAIVEFAGRHPDARVLYGAQIRQREPGGSDSEHGWTLYVDPFAGADLAQINFIDLGVLAVRRDHDQLWLDPSLRRMIDWEMVVRLAAVDEPRPVPVLASLYYARHDRRITDAGRQAEVDALVRRLTDPDDPFGVPRLRPGSA